MNQQKALIRISELLARFTVQVSILNANAQLDINIISEDILVPLLNLIYDYDLKNINYVENNNSFPAIDLIDKANGVTFQVTSTATLAKIKHTLEKVVEYKIYESCPKIFVYIITSKGSKYDTETLDKASQKLFNFTKNNILDSTDLYQKIASLSFEKIKQVEQCLEQQFADETKITKVEQQITLNLSQIIDKRRTEGTIKEIEGISEVRLEWIKKKLFLQKQRVVAYEVNQIFSIDNSIEYTQNKIIELDIEISTLLNNLQGLQNE